MILSHFTACFSQRLTHLFSDQMGKFFSMFRHEIEPTTQNGRTLLGGEPSPGRKGSFSGINGFHTIGQTNQQPIQPLARLPDSRLRTLRLRSLRPTDHSQKITVDIRTSLTHSKTDNLTNRLAFGQPLHGDVNFR